MTGSRNWGVWVIGWALVVLEYMSKNRPNPFHTAVFFLEKSCEILLLENFPIFQIRNISKDIFNIFFVRTRNILDKIWSNFGEMSEKDILNTKKKCNIFLLQKFPIFPIWKISKDVFRTLLWGPETVRKKYRVGFEIFPKRLFFLFSEKKVTKFFYWKNFRLFQFGRFQQMSSRLFCGDQKQSGKNIE